MAFLNELVGALLSPSVLICSFLLYGAGLAIYRLVFSPLAGFPGPKIAAATAWYEFYYNVVQGGQFTFHLQDLHDRYGPIIRINPWELHIRDPEFYETIYDGHGDRRDKFLPHCQWTDTGSAGQATVDHDLHKIRRAAQNPFFSKKQIQLFAPYIQSSVDKLIGRLANEFKGLKKPLTLSDAYGCFSGDIMMEYCFSKNHNFLDIPDFRSPFLEAVNNLETGVHVLVHFPWLLPLAKSLPEAILPAQVRLVFDFKKEMRSQIQDVMDDKNQGYKDAAHPTVFKSLLDSDLPSQEKTIDRLQDEGVTLVGAGQETVKATLTIATYHILHNPTVTKKLKEELLAAFPDPSDPPPLSKLEQLPYLSACIQEALRLSYGLTSRLVRVAPTPLPYGPHHTIPARTPISQNHYCMHHDEILFPDSHSFVPERWLDSPRAPVLHTPASSRASGPAGAPAGAAAGDAKEGGAKPLSRYLVSFMKGSRTCVGMHLAQAQLYLVLANVVRRCELELYETTWRDVGFVRDMFVPMAAGDGRGLRVLVGDVV